MNKIGDSLICVKEVEYVRKSKFTIDYTIGKTYKIVDITSNNGLIFLENNDTERHVEFYKNKNFDQKRIDKERKKVSTIWTEEQLRGYFVNVREQRKEKIKKIQNEIQSG